MTFGSSSPDALQNKRKYTYFSTCGGLENFEVSFKYDCGNKVTLFLEEKMRICMCEPIDLHKKHYVNAGSFTRKNRINQYP
jgi:hypothetical protein